MRLELENINNVPILCSTCCKLVIESAIMDEAKLESIINLKCFATVCRICLVSLENSEVCNINDCLVDNQEGSAVKEELVIREFLARCAAVEVSR